MGHGLSDPCSRDPRAIGAGDVGKDPPGRNAGNVLEQQNDRLRRTDVGEDDPTRGRARRVTYSGHAKYWPLSCARAPPPMVSRETHSVLIFPAAKAVG